MTALHSQTPPSSSSRRAQCPQSSTLEALYPEDEEGEEAREGVAAHWAAAEQLQGRLVDVGQIAPNGVVLTDEMAAGADLMFDDVTKTLAPLGLQPHQCTVESRVMIPRVHPTQFGSPDCFILLQGKPMKLYLWDYKFGHRVVEAFENLQMVEYAAGITHGIHDIDPGVEIVITIVQPRSFHREGPVRRWRTTLLDLRALINIASNSAHEALGSNPRAQAGPECRDCRARHACPALQQAGLAALDEARRVTPLEMEPWQAGLELRMVDRAIERLKARRTGLAEQLERAARNGKPTPGWQLVRGESREKWKVPAAQVIATGELLHLDLRKPVEAITPRQARERGLDPNIVAVLAERQPAGMELVEDDGSLARKVFG